MAAMKLRMLVFAAMLVAPSAPAGAEDCPRPGGIEIGRAEATGAAELRLADGRIVKLPGVAVPPEAAADARAFLSRLVADNGLRMVPLRPAPDRWGRIVAHLVTVSAQPVWVEAALVGAGLGVPNLFPGEETCVQALLAAEDRARAARLGLWAIERGPVLQAGDAAALASARGRFVVVEGAVVRVGHRDYATFIDFGRNWRDDLALFVPRAERAAIERTLGPLADLRGRTIRVRGILEPGERPRIRVTRAEAIQVLSAERRRR